MERYSNNGVLTIRVGEQLKGILTEISDTLKSETGASSTNAALVNIIREWLAARRDTLTDRQRMAFLFDQQTRAGQK